MRKIYPAPADEVRICKICHGPYTCRPREWARNFRLRKTCGKKCGKIFAAQQKTYLLKLPCGFCGTIFKQVNAGDKYCSRPCYWKSKKGKPATYVPPLTERIALICPQCGQTFMRPRYEVKAGRRFCPGPCYKLFRASQGLGTCFPKSGQNDFYLSAAWSALKRRIKKRDSYACQACARQFTYKSPGMIVHHIRPRELFQLVGHLLHSEADDPANLITLCKSCHQRTHAGFFPQFLDVRRHAPQQLNLLA